MGDGPVEESSSDEEDEGGSGGGLEFKPVGSKPKALAPGNLGAGTDDGDDRSGETKMVEFTPVSSDDGDSFPTIEIVGAGDDEGDSVVFEETMDDKAIIFKPLRDEAQEAIDEATRIIVTLEEKGPLGVDDALKAVEDAQAHMSDKEYDRAYIQAVTISDYLVSEMIRLNRHNMEEAIDLGMSTKQVAEVMNEATDLYKKKHFEEAFTLFLKIHVNLEAAIFNKKGISVVEPLSEDDIPDDFDDDDENVRPAKKKAVKGKKKTRKGKKMTKLQSAGEKSLPKRKSSEKKSTKDDSGSDGGESTQARVEILESLKAIRKEMQEKKESGGDITRANEMLTEAATAYKEENYDRAIEVITDIRSSL